MKLGFHYHIPFHSVKSGVYTIGVLGRFLDSLAVHCKLLLCFMHSSRDDELEQMDYKLQQPNIVWIDIGPHLSIPRRMLTAPITHRLIRSHKADIDIMLVRGPTPLLSTVSNAVDNTPKALLLVGDYLAGVDDLPQARWRKEAIRQWARRNYRQQLRVAQHALTFVNSHQLFLQLKAVVPNLVETRTTTLSADDFFIRPPTLENNPIHLIYVGRIDRAKGLFEIIQSMQILMSKGYDLVLDLVGWPAKGDTILAELFEDASQRGIGDRILYHGYKAIGPELFSFYRKADIFVIASLNSEGFPRAIWEAMANCLPVIATKVGSIPYYLEHTKNAVLVEPKSATAIAAAIELIIANRQLREMIVTEGLALARANTLQERALDMIQSMRNYCGLA